MKLEKKIVRAILAISASLLAFASVGTALVESIIGEPSAQVWIGLCSSLGVSALVLAAVGIALGKNAAEKLTKPIARFDPEDPRQTIQYEELEPLMERIRRQNETVCRQMEEMEQRHEQEDAMRRDFTANVSHELKTPLTTISGYAELIKTGLAKSEDVPRFAEKIYDESRRLGTLVGDIIMLSQLDSKEVNMPPENVDLYEIAEGALEHLRDAAEKKQLVCRLEGEHVTVHAPEQMVEAIVYNLCDNAVKYNQPGGTLDVAIRQCMDGVELTVADSGIGISKEDQKRIFERFFRADKSHSRELGGTGLGLSIVKHGAMFLGASVSVESEPGKGSTFRVLF